MLLLLCTEVEYQVRMASGRLFLKVFWVHPTGRKLWDTQKLLYSNPGTLLLYMFFFPW